MSSSRSRGPSAVVASAFSQASFGPEPIVGAGVDLVDASAVRDLVRADGTAFLEETCTELERREVAGDPIRLKSGSPELTVLEQKKEWVTAYWLDGMESKKGLFYAMSIERDEQRTKPS